MNSNLKIEQLTFMVKQLKDLYYENRSILSILENAQEMLDNRNVNLSADTIQKILVDKELNKHNLRFHKIIIENARKFAYQSLMIQAGYNISGRFGFSSNWKIIRV
jgi:hypothetical protein